MAENAELPFPDWNKPATKGELIQSLTIVYKALVDIQGNLIAIRLGNPASGQRSLEDLGEGMDALRKQIYRIGGRLEDEE